MPAVAVAGLLLALSRDAPVEITLQSDPPLPRPNLLISGDFEQGEDGKPKAWSFSTAMPENFRVGWVPEGRRGSKCVFVEALSGEMSGYWNQTVRVVPRVRYLLRGWYRLQSGKILIYAHARSGDAQLDARHYAGLGVEAALVPVFLKPEYLIGGRPDEWQQFRLEFSPPRGLKSATISLGMYFTGGKEWFDDIVLTEALVDLTISVSSKTPIGKVEIFRADEPSGKPLYSTGELARAQTTFRRTIRRLPADARFLVRVTTRAGRTVEKCYPELVP